MEVTDQEPTLPPLPPSLPPLNGRRKRVRDTEPPPTHSSTSSDPAFFSSDDDPALDNYQSHGRRKKRYVGSWYEQQPASSDSGVGEEGPSRYAPPRRVRPPQQPQQQKREFRRQLDSGVWMGADGCLTDTDDSFELEPAAPRLPLAPPRPQTTTAPSQAWSEHAEKDQAARNIIGVCVENGTEQVDLSDLGLETVSTGLLDQISEIVPIPTVVKELEFEQEDPQIKVFLSNNLLRSFPTALLNVEHLTVLSLRANRLVKLTPAITRLRNLETLNIAQNRLRFLPGELLQMLQRGSKLRTVQFYPNPFWQPDNLLPQEGAQEYEVLTFGPPPEIILDAPWDGMTTQLVSRSPVHLTDSANRTFSDFTIPSPTSKDVKTCPVEPFTDLATPHAHAIELRSHATSRLANPKGPRSLYELALSTCAASGQADRVATWLTQTHPQLAMAVEQAAEIRREGGARCAVCGRDMPLPFAQWLEFRCIESTRVYALEVPGGGGEGQGRPTSYVFDSYVPEAGRRQEGGLIPFLRVGCSWKCVPVRVEARESEAGGEALSI